MGFRELCVYEEIGRDRSDHVNPEVRWSNRARIQGFQVKWKIQLISLLIVNSWTRMENSLRREIHEQSGAKTRSPKNRTG
jgi:hypothetical protein